MGAGLFKSEDKSAEHLAYFQAQGLSTLSATDPIAFAQFLHSNSRLDRVVVGDYLGGKGEQNQKVLSAYVRQVDVCGLPIDVGVRAFVRGFTLPAEEDQIERIVNKFAEHYAQVNPALLSSGTAEVIICAIITLNMDAHRPATSKRMSKKQFMDQIKGIDNGHDVKAELLSDIYDRTTANEIKMH